MIILDCAQGGPEWLDARLGIPTASCFDKIIQPVKLQPAKATAYRNQLLAEWLLKRPLDAFSSYWMERGTEIEPEARAYYAEWYEPVREVGLILRDDRQVGGSPDGLVGDDGGLEVKCPKPETMVGYLLDPASLAAEYRHQIQGNLYISGREWWDILAYHPEMEDVRVRVVRDEAYLEALDKALEVFVTDLNEAKLKLQEPRDAELAA